MKMSSIYNDFLLRHDKNNNWIMPKTDVQFFIAFFEQCILQLL